MSMEIVLGAMERHSMQIAVHVPCSLSSVESTSIGHPFSSNTLFFPYEAGPRRGNKNPTEISRSLGGGGVDTCC